MYVIHAEGVRAQVALGAPPARAAARMRPPHHGVYTRLLSASPPRTRTDRSPRCAPRIDIETAPALLLDCRRRSEFKFEFVNKQLFVVTYRNLNSNSKINNTRLFVRNSNAI